jgi:hypothetical protein
MKLKVKYYFGDEVQTLLSDSKLIIMRMDIRLDGTVNYGCLNESGDIVWHFGYELKKSKKERVIGIVKSSD